MNDVDNNAFFHRTEMILGEPTMRRLAEARVILFGCGGVGSWAAEALIRSGLKRLTIVDPDVVAPSNINRQRVASVSTIGRSKVEALKEILYDINPSAEIVGICEAFTAESAESFRLEEYDYIIDAIDSLKHKAELIITATSTQATLISSMGAALRVDPMMVGHAEFWKVSGCRLAATLRRRFKRDGRFPQKRFECVYSKEPPISTPTSSETSADDIAGSRRMRDNGSCVLVTAAFGLAIASLVVRDISSKK